jgi:hypothetical protein
MVNHGKHLRRHGRRSERYRAWHREMEQQSVVCPHCRRATWPTRSAAQKAMRQTAAKPDFTMPDGFTTIVYACPLEHGWHWRVTVEGSDEEQVS